MLKEILGDLYVEDMSADDVKLALGQVYGNTDEVSKYKEAISRANSEAAEFKRKLREKMTEDEVKAAKIQEEREAFERLQREHAELQDEILVSKHHARFVGLGFENALAVESARGLVKGDFDTVFAGVEKTLTARENAIRAELLKKVPTPPKGDPSQRTKADLNKMSYEEMLKFANEYPEEYERLTKR